MKKFYYAIQLPCDPKFDFNCGYNSLDNLINGMRWNYGRDFHIEEREVRNCDYPVRYIVADNGDTYARIVEIFIQD